MTVNRTYFIFALSLGMLTAGQIGTGEAMESNATGDSHHGQVEIVKPAAAASASTWVRKGGSLSIDPQGWSNNPAIAAGGDRSLFVAWLQHRNPAVWEYSGVRVKQWTENGWVDLGGRIGHERVDPIRWPAAYDPSLAVVDGTVYLAWYEGGGYGWSKRRRAQVFVAHWNGAAWVADHDRADPDFGALSSAWGGRNPRLANVDGVLYAAWIAASDKKGKGNVISVKRLDGSIWSSVGEPLSINAGRGIIIDIAVASLGSALHVGWTEYSRHYAKGRPSIPSSDVNVVRLDESSLTLIGESLNVSKTGYANYLNLAAQGDTLHLVWQEKSATGNYRLFAKRWNGKAWTDNATQLSREPKLGEAGRPALGADNRRAWVAWSESRPGQKAQLYIRSWDGQTWSDPSSSMNTSESEGSAGSPEIAVVNGTPHVVWVEKHFPSSTKQVYLASRDDRGTQVAVEFEVYGEDRPTPILKPNTWTVLDPGGIVAGADGVGDEGYSSINYVSAIRRTVLFGKYHAIGTSYGEDQNALLGYNFSRNRWDIIEITENAWSEHLPGVGHDEGNVAVDSNRGIYYTIGNLTLNGATAYKAYSYDLLAGRGKRLLPVVGNDGGKEVTGAFDPINGVVFMRGRLYDVAENRWWQVENCAKRGWAGTAYDDVNKVFVQFGGASFNGQSDDTTWILNPKERRCEVRETSVSPPGGYAQMTFNSKYGLIMLMSGQPLQSWTYDVGANQWTRLADPPADFPKNHAGQKLTYDSDADVLLFHNGTDLRKLRGFRYVP